MFRLLSPGEFSLPEDFWENLPQNPSTLAVSQAVDGPDLTLSHYTHCFTLNVHTTKSNGKYRTTIRNESVACAREGSQSAPLDLPGYIVSSHTTKSFEEAMKAHAGAHERLNGWGY